MVKCQLTLQPIMALTDIDHPYIKLVRKRGTSPLRGIIRNNAIYYKDDKLLDLALLEGKSLDQSDSNENSAEHYWIHLYSGSMPEPITVSETRNVNIYETVWNIDGIEITNMQVYICIYWQSRYNRVQNAIRVNKHRGMNRLRRYVNNIINPAEDEHEDNPSHKTSYRAISGTVYYD